MDLCRSTHQKSPFSDHLVEAILQRAHRYDSEMIRVPTMFGPELHVPADAPISDRPAGFLGRHP